MVSAVKKKARLPRRSLAFSLMLKVFILFLLLGCPLTVVNPGLPRRGQPNCCPNVTVVVRWRSRITDSSHCLTAPINFQAVHLLNVGAFTGGTVNNFERRYLPVGRNCQLHLMRLTIIMDVGIISPRKPVPLFLLTVVLATQCHANT